MPKYDNEREFFARCAGGFEQVLSEELIGLRCKRVKTVKGGASFAGSYADGLRVCLWSRVATRVLMEVARASAHSADTLYAGVRKIPWERIVAPGATVAMHASGQNAALRNTQFTAVKVKDAVCDRLAAERGERPDVNGADPDFPFEISIYRDRATIFLSLSGPVLHKRGYREPGVQTEAPLKETLAAGMLLAAGWDEMVADGMGFADPLCGSGTLPIEAALMATNTAPGLLRERWGFESYMRHDPVQWEGLVAEARAARVPPAELGVRILGGDRDAGAVAIARANAQRAGVGDLLELYVDDAASLEKHLRRGRRLRGGLVACNPPYGHRLNAGEDLSGVYTAMRASVAKLDGNWKLAAISSDEGIDTGLGRVPYEVLPCRNGPLSTSLRVYSLDAGPAEIPITSLSGKDSRVTVAERASEQFAARLRKVARERAKWARKAGVQSYRVYDADLPDYAFSIDLFRRAADGVMLARVEERHAGDEVDSQRANRRFFDGMSIVAAVLDMTHEQVFFKRASRERGALASATCWTEVCEAEFAFEADLGSQRECGLLLDMRPVRELLRSEASGKRFGCLLAHAGAPTTYAAAGGAASTVTVDPSKVFLEQAKRTVLANGFGGQEHAFVCEDVLEWIAAQAKAGYKLDLAFCDLSAFPGPKVGGSTEKRPSVIQGVAQILAPAGKLLLVSRDRKFKLPHEALDEVGLTARDITADTIGHDFARTPKAHRAYLIMRPG